MVNKKYHKKYQKLLKLKNPKKYLKRVYKSVKKWRKNNPEKRKAQIMVFVHLRNGKLKKKACFCGKRKVEAHHKDYNKPLKIVWLCKYHHIIADKKRRKLLTP